jgi:hypothetical protein
MKLVLHVDASDSSAASSQTKPLDLSIPLGARSDKLCEVVVQHQLTDSTPILAWATFSGVILLLLVSVAPSSAGRKGIFSASKSSRSNGWTDMEWRL